MSTMKTTMVCMSHLKKTFKKKVFYCDYEPYKNLNIFILKMMISLIYWIR